MTAHYMLTHNLIRKFTRTRENTRWRALEKKLEELTVHLVNNNTRIKAEKISCLLYLVLF